MWIDRYIISLIINTVLFIINDNIITYYCQITRKWVPIDIYNGRFKSNICFQNKNKILTSVSLKKIDNINNYKIVKNINNSI